MISKQNLLLGTGAVGLGIAGATVYLTSSKTAKKESEQETSIPKVINCSSNPFGDAAQVQIGVEANMPEGDNLSDKLKDMHEIEPTEACFSFEGVTYSEENDNKKLKDGKFAFSAIKKSEDKQEGILVKTELQASNVFSGIVVSLSKSVESSWTIESGFGFSISVFDKELKVDKSNSDSNSFVWSKGTEKSLFEVLKEGESDNYKPLFGVGIKDIADAKVTKVYDKSNSVWKKVTESDDLKSHIKDVVKDDTKGAWTASN